jgi:GAF domain-containing protein
MPRGEKLATTTRQSRSLRGVIARKSQDLAAGHPELDELKAEFKTLRAQEYIEKVLAEAPPLTDEQRTRLAELFRPVGRGGDAA